MKITKQELKNFAESLTVSLETIANKIADIESIINGDDSVEETTDEVVEENENDMVEEPVVENEDEETTTDENENESTEDENFSEKHYSDVKNFFSL